MSGGAARVGAVIVAGGRGERFGADAPKQVVEVAGEPIVRRAVRALAEHPAVGATVVVVPREAAAAARVGAALGAWAGDPRVVAIVAGGARRQDSVAAGVAALPASVEIVAVHDAARPFPPAGAISAAIAAVEEGRAEGALLALAPADTIHVVDAEGVIEATPTRASLRGAQTPQVFRRDVLARALAAAEASGVDVTDEAQAVRAIGGRVVVVEGAAENLKITVASDLARAEAIAGGGGAVPWRVGIGYDVHRLVAGRPLILGGVRLEHPLGLDGHSDADVLAHAITDALLGAAGLGDIGHHFPPTDEAWRGADSMRLLAIAWERIVAAGWRLGYVDAVVMAQRPRLAPHLAAMRGRMAEALGVAPSLVHVKATTTERLGFVGREEGIAAEAVALLARA